MSLSKRITDWIKEYADSNGINHLVVGVSGGIDSAVVSTLCAKTKLTTIVVTMPIRQNEEQHQRSVDHCLWLSEKYHNVHFQTIDLTNVFNTLEDTLSIWSNELALANSRARLRMTTLYQIAQSLGGIVVGTGNKIEDFGVGFFTKYGDGGVDISPIADLYKSEVWDLGRELKISEDIINAKPTDGLWEDGRNDEDQLGHSYEDLEIAMKMDEYRYAPLNDEQKVVLEDYRAIRKRNLHKMQPIPVFRK